MNWPDNVCVNFEVLSKVPQAVMTALPASSQSVDCDDLLQPIATMGPGMRPQSALAATVNPPFVQ